MPRNWKNGSARDPQRESSAPGSSSDDDYGLIRAQQSDEEKSSLIVSASLASDYVRLFRPGEPGEIPILAPKKSSNWNTTLEFLGFVINSHTLEISAQAIKTALVDD